MGKLLISHNCRQLNLGDKSDKIKGDNLDPDKQERDVFLPLCCMLSRQDSFIHPNENAVILGFLLLYNDVYMFAKFKFIFN